MQWLRFRYRKLYCIVCFVEVDTDLTVDFLYVIQYLVKVVKVLVT